MMVAFEETESEMVAVSVHPLDERDAERKVIASLHAKQAWVL
jgi:hypothetical protein